MDLHCCRLTAVVSHECMNQGLGRNTSGDAETGAGDRCPDGGYSVRSTIPERTRGLPGCAAGGAYHPPHHPGRAHGVTGQLMQIDMATSRAGQVESQGKAGAPDPTAVLSWSEEQTSELGTSRPAMRTIRHQVRGLRQRSCTIPKKLLQHHTHCHNQWVKRRDSESLQAEPAAAWWAWLGSHVAGAGL